MMMNIQEIIMILYNKTVPTEYRVVMMRLVNLEFLACGLPEGIIGFLLFSEQPDVDITRRTVLRLGPVQRTGITLQHHHFESPPVVESGQGAYGFLIIGITALDFQQSLAYPLHFYRFGQIRCQLRGFVYTVQHNSRKLVFGSERAQGFPIRLLRLKGR